MSNFWLGLAAICAISLGTAFFAPISEVYKGLVALPSSGALVAALYQLVRDNAAHVRALEIQANQQIFSLGSASHMTNVVFDKHVEFCEKYLSEVHRLVVTLTREGPTAEALAHAGELYNLRVEYTAWITADIEDKLLPFEKAVREVGAKKRLIEAISKRPERDEQRVKALEEVFDTFSHLMDLDNVEGKDEQATIKAVKARVREILKVDELVSVRDFVVKKASDVATS